MPQDIRQALIAAKAQGPCSCPTPTPCYPIALAIVVSCGLTPQASVCNACRGLFNPPPASPAPVPFVPLP